MSTGISASVGDNPCFDSCFLLFYNFDKGCTILAMIFIVIVMLFFDIILNSIL